MMRAAGRKISEEEGGKRLTPSSTICMGAGGGEDISVLVSVDVPLVTLTSGVESEFCGCGGVLSCCCLF